MGFGDFMVKSRCHTFITHFEVSRKSEIVAFLGKEEGKILAHILMLIKNRFAINLLTRPLVDEEEVEEGKDTKWPFYWIPWPNFGRNSLGNSVDRG